MLDRGQKIVAIIGGSFTILGIFGGIWLGARGKADAQEMRAIGLRVTAIEPLLPVMLDLLKEQRADIKDMRHQLNEWGQTGRLPVISTIGPKEKP